MQETTTTYRVIAVIRGHEWQLAVCEDHAEALDEASRARQLLGEKSQVSICG